MVVPVAIHRRTLDKAVVKEKSFPRYALHSLQCICVLLLRGRLTMVNLFPRQ